MDTRPHIKLIRFATKVFICVMYGKVIDCFPRFVIR